MDKLEITCLVYTPQHCILSPSVHHPLHSHIGHLPSVYAAFAYALPLEIPTIAGIAFKAVALSTPTASLLED